MDGRVSVGSTMDARQWNPDCAAIRWHHDYRYVYFWPQPGVNYRLTEVTVGKGLDSQLKSLSFMSCTGSASKGAKTVVGS